MMLENADELYFVQCSSARAAKIENLRNITNGIVRSGSNTKWTVKHDGNVQRTILEVINESDNNDIILICGSFYIMADARKALGFSDCSDPISI